jgi:FtsH-binding integral membrane protein
MADEKKTVTVDDELAKLDTNGDGHISSEEYEMNMEFRRKELEDKDAQRDAIRKMAWFSLIGLLVYPIGIAITSALGMDKASELIADIAPTYFASIAVLVSAFFGADALSNKNKD